MAQSAGRADLSGFLIERTGKELKRAFQQTLAEINAGITADQWVVLDLLRTQTGISQLEIAERTSKDPPTVTRILDILADKKLIKRATDSADRRKMKIVLTLAGRKKVEALLPRVREFRLRYFDGLSKQDIDDLVRIMGQISKNIHLKEKS